MVWCAYQPYTPLGKRERADTLGPVSTTFRSFSLTTAIVGYAQLVRDSQQ
jgi:hypothetical protein